MPRLLIQGIMFSALLHDFNVGSKVAYA